MLESIHICRSCQAKFTLKDYQGAIDDCNKAIELEPNLPSIKFVVEQKLY